MKQLIFSILFSSVLLSQAMGQGYTFHALNPTDSLYPKNVNSNTTYGFTTSSLLYDNKFLKLSADKNRNSQMVYWDTKKWQKFPFSIKAEIDSILKNSYSIFLPFFTQSLHDKFVYEYRTQEQGKSLTNLYSYQKNIGWKKNVIQDSSDFTRGFHSNLKYFYYENKLSKLEFGHCDSNNCPSHLYQLEGNEFKLNTYWEQNMNGKQIANSCDLFYDRLYFQMNSYTPWVLGQHTRTTSKIGYIHDNQFDSVLLNGGITEWVYTFKNKLFVWMTVTDYNYLSPTEREAVVYLDSANVVHQTTWNEFTAPVYQYEFKSTFPKFEHNGKLYLVGWDNSYHAVHDAKYVIIEYDPSTESWNTKYEFIANDGLAYGYSYGGDIYLTGGFDTINHTLYAPGIVRLHDASNVDSIGVKKLNEPETDTLVINNKPKDSTTTTVIRNISNNAGIYSYPNPVKDFIYFTEPVSVTIYNAQGIAVGNTLQNKAYDMTTLPSGMYYWHSPRNNTSGKFLKL